MFFIDNFTEESEVITSVTTNQIGKNQRHVTSRDSMELLECKLHRVPIVYDRKVW